MKEKSTQILTLLLVMCVLPSCGAGSSVAVSKAYDVTYDASMPAAGTSVSDYEKEDRNASADKEPSIEIERFKNRSSSGGYVYDSKLVNDIPDDYPIGFYVPNEWSPDIPTRMSKDSISFHGIGTVPRVLCQYAFDSRHHMLLCIPELPDYVRGYLDSNGYNALMLRINGESTSNNEWNRQMLVFFDCEMELRLDGYPNLNMAQYFDIFHISNHADIVFENEETISHYMTFYIEKEEDEFHSFPAYVSYEGLVKMKSLERLSGGPLAESVLRKAGFDSSWPGETTIAFTEKGIQMDESEWNWYVERLNFLNQAYGLSADYIIKNREDLYYEY